MRDGRDQAVLHDAERHLGFDFSTEKPGLSFPAFSYFLSL
jgi:hypothetical protein